MQISVVTSDNLRGEELDGANMLKLNIRVGDTVYSVREREGELCISIDNQLAIKPIGANAISLSAGQIGQPGLRSGILDLTYSQMRLMERVSEAARRERTKYLSPVEMGDASCCAALGLLEIADDRSVRLTEAGCGYIIGLNKAY